MYATVASYSLSASPLFAVVYIGFLDKTVQTLNFKIYYCLFWALNASAWNLEVAFTMQKYIW